MRSITRDVNMPDSIPDYMAKSVADMNFDRLRKDGIKYIAFDADSTLVHFAKNELSDNTRKTLLKHKNKFSGWCIASNRRAGSLKELGADLGFPVFAATLFTRKPSRRYFRRLIAHFDANPEEIAMVGDKLIADMFGAKRMGLKTVWVERIGPDSIFDTLLRTRPKETKLIKEYLKHYQ